MRRRLPAGVNGRAARIHLATAPTPSVERAPDRVGENKRPFSDLLFEERTDASQVVGHRSGSGDSGPRSLPKSSVCSLSLLPCDLFYPSLYRGRFLRRGGQRCLRAIGSGPRRGPVPIFRAIFTEIERLASGFVEAGSRLLRKLVTAPRSFGLRAVAPKTVGRCAPKAKQLAQIHRRPFAEKLAIAPVGGI